MTSPARTSSHHVVVPAGTSVASQQATQSKLLQVVSIIFSSISISICSSSGPSALLPVERNRQNVENLKVPGDSRRWFPSSCRSLEEVQQEETHQCGPQVVGRSPVLAAFGRVTA